MISSMNTEQIVGLLVQERDRLSRAIEALGAPVKRRGRPPKKLPVAATTSHVAPAKKGWTAAQKKAQRQRMKAFWAKKRTTEK